MVVLAAATNEEMKSNNKDKISEAISQANQQVLLHYLQQRLCGCYLFIDARSTEHSAMNKHRQLISLASLTDSTRLRSDWLAFHLSESIHLILNQYKIHLL